MNADRVGEVRSWKGPQILGPGGVRTAPQEVSTIVGGVQQLRLSNEAELTDQYHAIYDDGSALVATQVHLPDPGDMLRAPKSYTAAGARSFIRAGYSNTSATQSPSPPSTAAGPAPPAKRQ